MDVLQADRKIKLIEFGVAFVEKFENKIKDYYESVEGGQEKPGKIASQVKKGAEFVKNIPVIGAVVAAADTAAPIVENKFKKEKALELIYLLDYIMHNREEARNKLLEAVGELSYMFEYQLGTVDFKKSWWRAVKKLADVAVSRAFNYFRKTSEDFSPAAVVKGVLLGQSKKSHHVTHITQAGNEVAWEAGKMFSKAGAVVKQLEDTACCRVHDSFKEELNYGYRLPCEYLKSWEAGEEFSDFNSMVADQNNALDRQAMAMIVLEVRSKLEKSNLDPTVKALSEFLCEHRRPANGEGPKEENNVQPRKEPELDPKPEWTDLHIAAASGKYGMVKRLVAENADISSFTDSADQTPLHVAAIKGHTRIVKHLAEADANKKACFLPDLEGFTPLHLAVREGHLELTEFFIENKFADKTRKNNAGWTPLFTAAREGYTNIVRYLIEKKEDDLEQKMENGYSLTHCAAEYDRVEVMKFLINEKMTSCNLKDNDGRAPVHIASEKGHMDIVRYLIDVKGVSCEEETNQGAKPVHCAAAGGQLQVLLYFLDEKGVDCNSVGYEYNKGRVLGREGAGDSGTRQLPKFWEKPVNFAAKVVTLGFVHDKDANKKYGGKTPLHYAAEEGHLHIVKHLVDFKNVAFNGGSLCDLSPMHYAAKNGHLSVLNYFLDEKEADPHQVTKCGNTLLKLASEGGHAEVMMYLLKNYNADWTVEDNTPRKMTPLLNAVEKGLLEVVKYIIEEKGCNPQQVNENGNLAHLAAGSGRLDILQYLLEEHPVDISVRGPNEWSILHFAACSSHPDTVKYLVEDKGIDVNVQTSADETPLHLAVLEEHKKLIMRGADYKVADNLLAGLAPFHLPPDDRNFEIIKFLCARNTDCKAVDKRGHSVLSLARLFCSEEIVEYLTRYSS